MQRRLGTAPLALLVAFALLPTATAEEGAVTAKSPVLFQGLTEVRAGEGAAVFASDEPGFDLSLDLTASRAVIEHYRSEMTCPSDVPGGFTPCVPSRADEDMDERYEIQDLVLTGSPSQVSALFLSWEATDGATSRTLVDGVAELAVDDDAAECDDPMCDAVSEAAARKWYFAAPSWDLVGQGGFELYINGLNLQIGGLVDGEPFQANYETGDWDDGGSPVRKSIVDIVTIRVEQGDLRLGGATPGRLYGELAATVDGTTTLYGASGEFAVGGTDYDLASEDATLPGPLTVVPAAVIDTGERMLVLRIEDAAPLVAPPPIDPSFDTASTAMAAGIGGAALGLFTLAWFWPYLKYVGTSLMVLPMYSRIGREDVLEHGKREEIFGLIRDVPGIHAHEISSRAVIGWGTTVYHLKLLENHGLIVGKRTGRYKRFFATAGGAARNVDHYAVLRNDTTSAIAKHVLAHPGCIQKDVCAALNLAPSLVTWHMNRLEEVDLVKKVREGRTVKYYAGGSWGGLHMDFSPENVTATLVDAGAN